MVEWQSIIIKILTFLDVPKGKIGWSYHLLLMIFSFIYIIFLLLETSDGPNHYTDRDNMQALYFYLPTAYEYFVIKIILSAPLLIHVFLDIILVSILYFLDVSDEKTHQTIKRRYSPVSKCLLVIWAFYFSIISAHPELENFEVRGIYHIFDFLRYAQIILSLKSVPEFFVVNETYKRVIKVVLIPLLIFSCFNITSGLLFYIVDPCFNISTCPFENLPEAVFYSVVTMTTTGYGNQTPQFVLGRIFAIFVMLCGAPYLAIPIAIIDAEFGRSWRDLLSKQLEEEKLAKAHGLKLTGKLVSQENAVLATSNTVPQGKLNALGLYARISETLSKSITEVSLAISSASAPASPFSEQRVQQSKRLFDGIANVIIGISKLQHEIATFSNDIVTTDEKQATGRGPNAGDNTRRSSQVSTGDRRRGGLLRIESTKIAAVSTRTDGTSTVFKSPHDETAFLLGKLQSEALTHPLRSSVRLLLDLPSSSNLAYAYHVFMVVCIILSIILLFWQSLLLFIPHGEGSILCSSVVEIYCANKDSALLDPGCYISSSVSTIPEKLQYSCTSSNCFGIGTNFGGETSNLTCVDYDTHLSNGVHVTRPFQEQASLDRLSYFHPWTSFQQNYDICNRRECSTSELLFDATIVWLWTEIVINLAYILDLCLRIYTRESVKAFLSGVGNWVDIISVFPFIVDIFLLCFIDNYGFEFLPTSPHESFSFVTKILKLLRMFKLVRRFPEAQVVGKVFYKARKDLFWFGLMMFLIASCVGLILFDVNGGRPCFIGSSTVGSCPTSFVDNPASGYDTYPQGRRVIVSNTLGNTPMIYSAFHGMWYAMVTMCTVGYGDIYPVYMLENFISLVLMVLGSFLFAIPISIISRHFSASYEAMAAAQRGKQEALQKLLNGNASVQTISLSSLPASLDGSNGNGQPKLSKKALKLLGLPTDDAQDSEATVKVKDIKNHAKEISAEYSRYASMLEVHIKYLCKSLVSIQAQAQEKEQTSTATSSNRKPSWQVIKQTIRKSSNFVMKTVPRIAPTVIPQVEAALGAGGGPVKGNMKALRGISEAKAGMGMGKHGRQGSGVGRPGQGQGGWKKASPRAGPGSGPGSKGYYESLGVEVEVEDIEEDDDFSLSGDEGEEGDSSSSSEEEGEEEVPTVQVQGQVRSGATSIMSLSSEGGDGGDIINSNPPLPLLCLTECSLDSDATLSCITAAGTGTDISTAPSTFDTGASTLVLSPTVSITASTAAQTAFAIQAFKRPVPVPVHKGTFYNSTVSHNDLLKKSLEILKNFLETHFSRGETVREICGFTSTNETAALDILEVLKRQLQTRELRSEVGHLDTLHEKQRPVKGSGVVRTSELVSGGNGRSSKLTSFIGLQLPSRKVKPW